MKISNKSMSRLILISVILTIIVLILKSSFSKVKEAKKMNIKQAIESVKNKYGKHIARNVEKIFRLETAHFTSGGFKNTLAAGQLIFAPEFPWGWYGLQNFWLTNPNYKPVGKWSYNGYDYLKFETLEASFMTVAEILKQRGNDVGRYNSNDPVQQQKYRDAIATIQAKYV